MKNIKKLIQQYEKLQGKIFKNLEIVSLKKEMKTGVDAFIKLNGESISSKFGIGKIDFYADGEGSIIKLWCCKLNGEVSLTKDKKEFEEYIFEITTPIKKLHINYHNLTLTSNNTSMGTEISYKGEKLSHIVSVHATIGSCEEITEMEFCVC